MEIAIGILVGLHLIGFATILGGLLSEMRNMKTGAKVTPGVIHGAWLALGAGLILTGLVSMNGENVNNLTLSIKGIGITGIFFIAYTYQKKENTPKWVVPVLLLLTLMNLFTATIMGMVTE